jgi:hypothetical protein
VSPLNRQCAGITRDGRHCTFSVSGPQQFCHLHDPDRSEERTRAARSAGKAKRHTIEVRDLKAEIRTLISAVRTGELDRNDAAVMIQGFRTLKDLIALERQVRETDELAAEIEELKRAYGAA